MSYSISNTYIFIYLLPVLPLCRTPHPTIFLWKSSSFGWARVALPNLPIFIITVTTAHIPMPWQHQICMSHYTVLVLAICSSKRNLSYEQAQSYKAHPSRFSLLPIHSDKQHLFLQSPQLPLLLLCNILPDLHHMFYDYWSLPWNRTQLPARAILCCPCLSKAINCILYWKGLAERLSSGHIGKQMLEWLTKRLAWTTHRTPSWLYPSLRSTLRLLRTSNTTNWKPTIPGGTPGCQISLLPQHLLPDK